MHFMTANRSAAEDATEAFMSYVMSSTVGLKTDTIIGSVKSRNSAVKETMITMALLPPASLSVVTRSGRHPRRRQGVLLRLEAGLMASKLQSIGD
jgi:hypothetical protein